jgi:hypothetical protein
MGESYEGARAHEEDIEESDGDQEAPAGAESAGAEEERRVFAAWCWGACEFGVDVGQRGPRVVRIYEEFIGRFRLAMGRGTDMLEASDAGYDAFADGG